MKKILLLAVLLLIPSLAKADTPAINEKDPTIIDYVWDGFHKLPNMKEGGLWDIKKGTVKNTLGIEVANAGFFGQYWKNVSLDGILIGSDGLGGSLNLSLAALPVENVPIIKYLEYAYVGYGIGISHITHDPSYDANQKSDNEWTNGITFGGRLNF